MITIYYNNNQGAFPCGVSNMQRRRRDKTYLFVFFRFIILLVLLMAGFFYFINFAKAGYIEVNEDIVWTLDDSPVVIEENIWITEQGSLTIEPGVIIKFAPEGFISINGFFIAEGTAEDPIVFTSIKDDEYGGDTNGDGDATSPESADWKFLGFNINMNNNILNNAIIKYGGSNGGGAINIFKSKLTINNAFITDNAAAIKSNQSEFTINNSIIYNNLFQWSADVYLDSGISNNNDLVYTVNAINNWWGSDQEPCLWRETDDVIEECSSRVLLDNGVIYDPWLMEEPNFINEEPEPEYSGPEPIILVPGITACVNLKVLTDLEESSYDWEIFGQYYQGLIKTIEATGFTEGEDFFIGCYDWRKTNGYNSDEVVNSGEEYLTYWIDRALENSSSTKVDIVAHSMGGLLARSYIQGDRYRDDVDQFIMIGTPNYGAASAYHFWEGGEVPEQWQKFKWILKPYLTYLKFKGFNITKSSTVQQNIPSIKQLLPTYDYLIDKESELTLSNDAMQEQNSWLKNLNQTENLEKLTERTSSVKIIYGDGLPTRNTITVDERTLLDITLGKWLDGRPDENIIDNRNNGDKTVLVSSATIEGIASSTIESGEHGALPDQSALLVLEELGIESEQVFSSPEISDMLMVIVASPVEPVITTADNKQVGKDVNEVENAQYFSAGDGGVKLIFIPNPTEGGFSVSLTGTGTGSYNIASIYTTGDSTTETEAGGEVQSGENIIYTSNLVTGNNSDLGELSLPASEESEPEQAENNPSSGGGVPLWFLQEMNKNKKEREEKVLGIKIKKEEEREDPNIVFRINLFYSPTMEEALLNNYYY